MTALDDVGTPAGRELAVFFPPPWKLLRTDPELTGADLDALFERATVGRDTYQAIAEELRGARIQALAMLDYPEDDPVASARAVVTRIPLPPGGLAAAAQALSSSGDDVSTLEFAELTVLRVRRYGPVEALAVRLDDGRRVAPVTLSVRYLTDMGDGSAAVVDCETPTTAYAEEFERIFDATASQLRFE